MKKFFSLLVCIAVLLFGCASGMQQKMAENATPEPVESQVQESSELLLPNPEAVSYTHLQCVVWFFVFFFCLRLCVRAPHSGMGFFRPAPCRPGLVPCFPVLVFAAAHTNGAGWPVPGFGTCLLLQCIVYPCFELAVIACGGGVEPVIYINIKRNAVLCWI